MELCVEVRYEVRLLNPFGEIIRIVIKSRHARCRRIYFRDRAPVPVARARTRHRTQNTTSKKHSTPSPLRPGAISKIQSLEPAFTAIGTPARTGLLCRLLSSPFALHHPFGHATTPRCHARSTVSSARRNVTPQSKLVKARIAQVQAQLEVT